MNPVSSVKVLPLSVFRFLTVLGLSVWIGGLAFFGAVAAPVMAHTDRSLLFVLVAPMLARFSVVTYVCAALMLVGWIGEGVVKRAGGRSGLLWNFQGASTILMLCVALYLGRGLMPQIQDLQKELRKPSTIIGLLEDRFLKKRDASVENGGADKSRFDVAHERYTQLSQVTVWLGLATMFVFCWRVTSEGKRLPGSELES